MINYLKIRDKIQNDIIRKYLLGPMNGPEEIIKNDSPLNFYITGILYPQEENNLNDDGSESERRHCRAVVSAIAAKASGAGSACGFNARQGVVYRFFCRSRPLASGGAIRWHQHSRARQARKRTVAAVLILQCLSFWGALA